MLMSHHQNTCHDHNIKTANRSSKNVAKFNYLEMRLTNPKCIHEEIKRKINLRNACYHSVLNLFVFLPAI
jgi:hypothetical protein